jgi:hypothetical protein
MGLLMRARNFVFLLVLLGTLAAGVVTAKADTAAGAVRSQEQQLKNVLTHVQFADDRMTRIVEGWVDPSASSSRELAALLGSIDSQCTSALGSVTTLLARVAAACASTCPGSDPVCGVDGVTYGCAQEAQCRGVEVAHAGACPVDCGTICSTNNPVCGVDGVTYSCAQEAQCHGVEVAHAGACPVNCGSICSTNDPVCGVDGNTYHCMAEAQCHGVEVAYEGECRGGCTCSGELAPVCGTDGNTYINASFAACAGVEIAHEGACLR